MPHRPDTVTPCDPHDRNMWLSYDDCMAWLSHKPELNAGVVFSDSDNYFFLDLDDCEENGKWKEGVGKILSRFPDAAVELSVSGRGLHVMGVCDASVLGDRKNKFTLEGIQCEFYHKDRFMALGAGFEGNPDIDHTAALSECVPVRQTIDAVVFQDVADPSWCGSNDDNELVQIMINAKATLTQAFSAQATNRQLWEGDIEALSAAFPSVTGDAFDRSSADLALMNKLAFYTGKNTARMDRLFKQSGLMREKYATRERYAIETITRAVGGTNEVYSHERFRDIVKHEPSVTDQSPVAITEFPPLLNIHDQEEYFKGCIYVRNIHRVLMPDGTMASPASFKSFKGGHEFVMSYEGTKPTFNAFEALTENRTGTNFRKAVTTRFKPDLPFQSPVAPDGVNVYKDPELPCEAGDPSPVLNLLHKILPVEADREIFLSWLAAVVQYKGKKILWSPVIQGTQGNGKSVWTEIIKNCVGKQYCTTISPDKLGNTFNSHMSNKIFINVEEMNMFSKHSVMEQLKDLITSDSLNVEAKGVDSVMDYDYCANWFFTTNHKDAIIKERNDRRFAMFFTAQQSASDIVRDGMGGDYFPNLWAWLRSGGFSIMHHFLLTYPIPEHLNPFGAAYRAPVTSSTEEAVQASFGVAEQYINEAIENEEMGFRGGWISTVKVAKVLDEVGRKRGPAAIGKILRGMGYEQRFRSSRNIINEDMKKPIIYALPHVTGDISDYERAQGYTT